MLGGIAGVDVALRMHDQASREFKRVMSGIETDAGRTERAVSSLALGIGALGGVVAGLALAGGAIGKNFLDTAADMEDMETRLRTVSTSAQEADESFAWVQDFAQRTPYEMTQVLDAFIKAKAYGIDPTTGALQAAGDAASAMGKDLGAAVEAMADARLGEFERLKEFGVKARTEGDRLVFTWTDTLGKVQQTVSSKSPEIIQQTLETIWNARYKGGMEAMSHTWNGMMSNLSDSWTMFKDATMDSGAFAGMKGGLAGVLEEIQKLKEDGTLKVWAESTGDIFMSFAETVGGGASIIIRSLSSLNAMKDQLDIWNLQDNRLLKVAELDLLKNAWFPDPTLIAATELELADIDAAIARETLSLEKAKTAADNLDAALERLGGKYTEGRDRAYLMSFGPFQPAAPSGGSKGGDKPAAADNYPGLSAADLMAFGPGRETLPIYDTGRADEFSSAWVTAYKKIQLEAARTLALEEERDTRVSGISNAIDRYVGLRGDRDLGRAESQKAAQEKMAEIISLRQEAFDTLGTYSNTYYARERQQVEDQAALLYARTHDAVAVERWKAAQLKEIQEQELRSSQVISEEYLGAAQTVAGAWGNAMADMLVYGENFTKTMQGMIKNLAAQAVSDLAIFGLFSMFGAGASASGGPFMNIFKSIFHEGGVVGARKYHEGGMVYAHGGLNLKRDEVPIIAQTGERVVSRRHNEDLTAAMNAISRIDQRLSAGGGNTGGDIVLPLTLQVDGARLGQTIVRIGRDGGLKDGRHSIQTKVA